MVHALVKEQSQGQGQSSIIKFGDKEEFAQLITYLKASNFSFHMLKLLFECYWLLAKVNA